MFVIYLLFEVLFFISPYLELSLSSPEKDCSASTSIEKIPDTTDCQYFHYCGKGFTKPLKQKCPNDQASGYNLWFNPTVGKCDHKKNAPATCSKVANKTDSVKLNEDFKLQIDCADKGCGVFPSRTKNSCGSYVVCTDGETEIKKCAKGQTFDIKTQECKPKGQGECWKVKEGGKDKVWKGESTFPNFTASEPYEVNPDNSTILQSENITNWGDWQEWLYCPEGMFVTQDAAKRLKLEPNKTNTDNTDGNDSSEYKDDAGIGSVLFRCQTPGNNKSFKDLETLVPGGDIEPWSDKIHSCLGVPAIGFQLNQVMKGANGDDELGTNGLQVLCALLSSKDNIKDRDDNPPGHYTDPRFCGIHQAICGYQAQMHTVIKNRGRKEYDNTGLNNLRVKCCNVEDPLKTCTPKEERRLTLACDNSKGEDILKCIFKHRVGYAANTDDWELSKFYTSIGYNTNVTDATQVERIKNEMIKKTEAGEPLEYKWNTNNPDLWKRYQLKTKHIYANPFENFYLYQIVVKCFHYMFKSSGYVKVVKDEGGKTLSETHLDVNLSSMSW